MKQPYPKRIVFSGFARTEQSARDATDQKKYLIIAGAYRRTALLLIVKFESRYIWGVREFIQPGWYFVYAGALVIYIIQRRDRLASKVF